MNFSFAEEYKKWSNEQLFDLLKNKQLYQPSAVTAAEFEFSSRNLIETELEALESHYAEIQKHKQSKLQKLAEKNVASAKERVLYETDLLAKKNDEMRLRVFCYSIGLMILIMFAVELDLIRMLFKNRFWMEPIEALTLSQFFFVPVGLYFFWNKKNFGWKILTIWLVVITVILIVSFYQEIIFYNKIENEDSSAFIKFIPAFDNKPDYTKEILTILFYGLVLFYINTKNITSYFNLGRKTQWLTVGTTAVLSFIYFMTR